MQSGQPPDEPGSSELAAIVGRFLQPQPVESPQFTPIAGGFSGAGVWKVDQLPASFALRRWPVDGLPARRITGLHRLLRHIHDSGIDCVAVPLLDRHGHSLVSFGRNNWQLEPWMPGHADFQACPTAARLRNTATTLAKWHLAAARFECPDSLGWFQSRHGPSPAVTERLQRIRTWRDRISTGGLMSLISSEPDATFRELAIQILQHATQAFSSVQAQLQELRSISFALQPCLRDIWHDHVLFTNDNVTGLIDASACRTENVATDLVRLLGSLVGDDQSQWNDAIEAYAAMRSLTATERRLIRALDQSAVVLSPLTWLDRRYIRRIQFADLPAVLNRLRVQSKRLAALTRSHELS